MTDRSSRRKQRDWRLVVGLSILVVLAIAAVAGDHLTPYASNLQNLRARRLPPLTTSVQGHFYLLGTDQFGRDLFSRLVVGVRIPLVIALSSASIGGLLGMALGLMAGFYGGIVDRVVSVLIDVQLSLPYVLVGLLVLVLFGSSASNIILIFVLLSWPTSARMARASAISLRSMPFVEAARSYGAAPLRIMLRHVLPNTLPVIVAVASVQVATFIIYEAAFGFFGLGVPPPEPTWGNMLADSRNYIRDAWWLCVFPGLGIMTVALAANLCGQALSAKLRSGKHRMTG